jgi:hypothetical protein
VLRHVLRGVFVKYYDHARSYCAVARNIFIHRATEQYAAALSFLTEEPAPPAAEAEPGSGGLVVADFEFPDEADMFRQVPAPNEIHTRASSPNKQKCNIPQSTRNDLSMQIACGPGRPLGPRINILGAAADAADGSGVAAH